MGFYLRKSFRMGPVRLNLSKSGLGVSAGVRGARLGLTSTGRSYVHAGRGGLYLRKYLAPPSIPRATQQSVGFSEPTVLYEDTGVTFASSKIPQSAPRLASQLVRRKEPVAAWLLIPLGGILVGWLFADGSQDAGTPAGLLVAIALLVLWPIPAWRAWRKNRAGDQLGRLLESSLVSRRPLADPVALAISRALVSDRITPHERDYQSRHAYLQLVLSIVDDRDVTAEESTLLNQVEDLLQLPTDFVLDARADAFRNAYLEIIADEALTADEEQRLTHLQEALSIPPAAIEAELLVAERLRDIRIIREQQLPILESGTPLQKGEVCHYEAPVRVLKETNLKSFQSAGQKYKVRGLVIEKEGVLIVTSKRVLLIHQGTTSVRHDKILDLDVDYDRSLLIITKDGSRSPVLLTTPDAMKAGAIIATVAGL